MSGGEEVAQLLGELAALHAAGLLNDREFVEARRQLLHEVPVSGGTVSGASPVGASATGRASELCGSTTPTRGPTDSGRDAAAAARSTGPRFSRRRTWPAVAMVLATLVVSLGVATLVPRVTAPAVAAAQVRTEPVGSAGPNPFMPSVGDSMYGVTAPAGSVGAFTGDTPGLFGGRLDDMACDRDAMAEFLSADPAKAFAWGAVQQVPTSDVPEYVGELTPVILRADTAVTNHGFVDGRATPFASILQAGTAVLVDEYGVPRARCSCGNPLLPAAAGPDAVRTGESWPGFSPRAVTSIGPAAVPVAQFTLVDPFTEAVFTRPRGTTGEQDRLSAMPANGSPAAAPSIPAPGPAPATRPDPSAVPGPTGVPGPTAGDRAPAPQALPDRPPDEQVRPADPVPEVRQLDVVAADDWQSTGVSLEPGDVLAVAHVGSSWSPFPGYSYDGRGCIDTAVCDQDPDQPNNICCLAHGGLLGRIGNGPPFAVGNGVTVDGAESGVVSLRMNDTAQGDNSGALTVRVTRTPSG